MDLPALVDVQRRPSRPRSRPRRGHARCAAHLESTLVAVAAAADDLRAQADEALKLRESTWAPIAAQLGGWVPLESDARALDGTVKTMTAAKKWMTDHAVDVPQSATGTYCRAGAQDLGATASGEQRRPRRDHAARAPLPAAGQYSAGRSTASRPRRCR